MRAVVSTWICVALAALCQGRVISVDDDGPADFNNIRAAVEDANTGDTVIILPGVYRGSDNCGIELMGKSLTIRSRSGRQSVEIDCEGKAFGIYVCDNRAGTTRIEGLTIRRAMHGAIKCYNSHPPHAPTGIPFRPGFADVIVANCRLVDSVDGGFLLDGHDNVTMVGCEIADNGAGGVYSYMSAPTIRNCVIARNAGYGVYATYPNIVNCTIVRNSTHGVSLWEGTVSNSIIRDNAMQQIYNSSTRAIVSYSNIGGGWPGEGNIDANPLFADGDAGDFHLKSQAGRWLSDDGRWTMDDVTGPCIDAGDPLAPIGLEPFPNGGRVNMGAFGGTAEASKSYFGGPVCETIVAGDIDGDCRVDFRDMSILLLRWLWSDPPIVRITAPLPDEVIGRYQANVPILIAAEAGNTRGTVVRVEFFISGPEGYEVGKVGEDTDGSDGWSCGWIWWGDWGHHPEGSYTATAVATDDNGQSTISRPVTFYVHGPR